MAVEKRHCPGKACLPGYFALSLLSRLGTVFMSADVRGTVVVGSSDDVQARIRDDLPFIDRVGGTGPEAEVESSRIHEIRGGRLFHVCPQVARGGAVASRNSVSEVVSDVRQGAGKPVVDGAV